MANDATLHIRLEKNLKQELEDYSKYHEIKLSNVIRLALEEFSEKCLLTKTTISQDISEGKINYDRF